MVKNWPITPWHHPSLWHYPLAPVWCHPSSPLAPPSGVARVGLLPPALVPAPTIPTSPCPQAVCLGEEPLALAPPPSPGLAHAKMMPLPESLSSTASVIAAVGAAQRPYSCSCRRGFGTCLVSRVWHQMSTSSKKRRLDSEKCRGR